MTTGASAMHEEEKDIQTKRDQAWLKSVAVDIYKINPYSQEFEEFSYLWRNKKKIIRNRNLIDLLG